MYLEFNYQPITVTQRQSIQYSGSLQLLQHVLQQTAGEVETVAGDADNKKIIRAFGSIDIIWEPRIVTLEWIASPCSDMFADAVLSAILQVFFTINALNLDHCCLVPVINFKYFFSSSNIML